ncbi:hypothetical protein JANAI62_03960 [Jannaschia pagri]|uniref:Uncharacterized protein n=1 Tax=Jannaschia pagri TaxID=2829797 RepID=A0ABQ4NH63_9RHOB|nr:MULTISPECIES: hypothetical protein [unclassified Jannaschia]GIT90121.1 hypothetical protein JANAI61_05790 [Jannaschia sp. AI_61]GIT93773.1 hypothetical protein JANAI62_03960 [Jannaschia sp. AI_62]
MSDIRHLADDEVIREPGLYAMPLERHHGQPCDGVSVTSGILRGMELKSPADVWAFHQLNPGRFERPVTAALRMGQAMAALIEGGIDTLNANFVVSGGSAPRRPTIKQMIAYDEGRATDAGRESVEYWRAMEADTRTVVSQAEFDLIVAMGGVLAQSPEAAAVMSGLPEVTMAWQCPETGLWVLSRPDTVSLDGMTSDYKKMSTKGGAFDYRLVDRRITDHAYDMQMALAAESLEVLGYGWPASVGIVAQCDAPPYHVILREIPEHVLRVAQFRNRRARLRFAECLDSRRWPGPGEDTGAYQYPEWLEQRLLSEQQVANQ